MGSTSTIGLIVPDMLNPFFPQLADAVERAAQVGGLKHAVDERRERPRLGEELHFST